MPTPHPIPPNLPTGPADGDGASGKDSTYSWHGFDLTPLSASFAMLTTERGAVLAAVDAVDSEGPDAALDDSEEPLRENDGSCIGIHFMKTRARVLDWQHAKPDGEQQRKRPI